jgi:hypothetical protein
LKGVSVCRWRDLAIQHLPGQREIIAAARSHADLWWSFKELLARTGVSESRKAEAESIYSYAWWCIADSDDPDLGAEVETYFYEDLPVYPDFQEQVPLFISPMQFERLQRAFAYRLSEEELDEFRLHFYRKQPKNTA